MALILFEIMNQNEQHHSHRTGWLRAIILGANDGIVSTASLIIGVAAAHSTGEEILLAGIAGVVAGAMSMAAGEYVSVSSQADAEKADIALEKQHLVEDIDFEFKELTEIYIKRGLDKDLAKQVAEQLMAYDALEAHLRDELGIRARTSAKPVQAALFSAAAFTSGALMPLAALLVTHETYIIFTVASFSLLSLALLGALGAYLGGARVTTGIIRVSFWGSLAMLFTAVIGRLFGIVTA